MDLATLVHECVPKNVSAHTMQQVASVESTSRPYAIGYKLIRWRTAMVNGTLTRVREVHILSTQPKNKADAIEWAKYLLAEGYEFDAGPLQVHSTNFKPYGLTAETVFDTCTNVRVGAEILTECYARAARIHKAPADALKAALHCYRWGRFSDELDTDYINKIVRAKVNKTAD